ncbi:MAG: ATP-binding protein [Bacteroidetes bacterium]|nr:ATP-binding protein [Bacteroidota bacterium]
MSRIYDSVFEEKLRTNKIIWLEGPMGSGKSTYAGQVLRRIGFDFETIDFHSILVRKKFNELTLPEITWYFNQNTVYILKDVQYFKALQHLIDLSLSQKIKPILILTTSFKPGMNAELTEAIRWEGLSFYYSPKTYYERTMEHGIVQEEKNLENRLVFGNMFPTFDEERGYYSEMLTKKMEELLIHQLGVFERINKKKPLFRLLQLLALKVGEGISYNELAEIVELDNETVDRYISLFQAAHILIVIPTMFNDKRYEIKKQHVVYFIDNGIRNALIGNFTPFEERFDKEILWKNWLISERFKWIKINQKIPAFYFWKSHTRQFVDLIEILDNEVIAIRCSWGRRKIVKKPSLFANYYPNVIFKSIHRNNYLSFLARK